MERVPRRVEADVRADRAPVASRPGGPASSRAGSRATRGRPGGTRGRRRRGGRRCGRVRRGIGHAHVTTAGPRPSRVRPDRVIGRFIPRMVSSPPDMQTSLSRRQRRRRMYDRRRPRGSGAGRKRAPAALTDVCIPGGTIGRKGGVAAGVAIEAMRPLAVYGVLPRGVVRGASTIWLAMF